MLLAAHCASTRRGCRYVKWRMPGIGNSTGGEWSSSLSCMDPTDKSYVVATEISLTRQRVRQFRVYRRLAGSYFHPSPDWVQYNNVASDTARVADLLRRKAAFKVP